MAEVHQAKVVEGECHANADAADNADNDDNDYDDSVVGNNKPKRSPALTRKKPQIANNKTVIASSSSSPGDDSSSSSTPTTTTTTTTKLPANSRRRKPKAVHKQKSSSSPEKSSSEPEGTNNNNGNDDDDNNNATTSTTTPEQEQPRTRSTRRSSARNREKATDGDSPSAANNGLSTKKDSDEANQPEVETNGTGNDDDGEENGRTMGQQEEEQQQQERRLRPRTRQSSSRGKQQQQQQQEQLSAVGGPGANNNNNNNSNNTTTDTMSSSSSPPQKTSKEKKRSPRLKNSLKQNYTEVSDDAFFETDNDNDEQEEKVEDATMTETVVEADNIKTTTETVVEADNNNSTTTTNNNNINITKAKKKKKQQPPKRTNNNNKKKKLEPSPPSPPSMEEDEEPKKKKPRTTRSKRDRKSRQSDDSTATAAASEPAMKEVNSTDEPPEPAMTKTTFTDAPSEPPETEAKTNDASGGARAPRETRSKKVLEHTNDTTMNVDGGADTTPTATNDVVLPIDGGQQICIEIQQRRDEPEPFEVVEDPNEYYIEEEAHLYHNPPLPSSVTQGVLPKDLRRIPPPPPPPSMLPNTGHCTWTYNSTTRVLLGKFDSPVIDSADELFLLHMLERDDITVVSEGLLDASKLDEELWNRGHWSIVLGSEFHHKFRRFDTVKKEGKEEEEKCLEVDRMYSMSMRDYMEYLHRRETYIRDKTGDPNFSFTDHNGKEHTIHVGVACLYMIDLDLKRLLPDTYENFMESFGYHKVLPGGKHCMMNSITPNARPFMGPNVYITPPAAFTHFHQDGHGTVDSGHLVITGYNEVVMLRRLTERHKKHALWLLTGDQSNDKNSKLDYFDGLYSEPHGDGLGEKPSWPTHERIQQCEEMGYCPSVIILEPGQLIHINKGRLHAFRKMATTKLPKSDCHCDLRAKVVEQNILTGEVNCISVAWDWMFRGATTNGINREICSVIEAAILNRKHGRMSLAIPETSLLQMAKVYSAVDRAKLPRTGFGSLLKNSANINGDGSTSEVNPAARSIIDVCRGILPGLRYVVGKHIDAMEAAGHKGSLLGRGERVTIAKRPNTHEDPMSFPVDPYGDSDFLCKLCSKELSNVYYHCDGCETLLSKDFNICGECHAEKIFMMKVQMHPLNDKRHSTINHTGNMKFDRYSRCPCKNGPVCKHCTYCSGCSCRCHTWFTLHSRFFGMDGEAALLQRVEDAVKTLLDNDSKKGNRYLDDREFLEQRFALAAKKYE